MGRLKSTLRNDLWTIILDAISVNVAYLLALVIRFYVNNAIAPSIINFIDVFYSFAPWYTLICLVVFYVFRLYGGLWRYAGIRDMNRIVAANAVTFLVQVIGTQVFFGRMPRSYYIGGAALQFIFIVLIRFAYRLVVVEKRRTGKKSGNAIIVGVGDMGLNTAHLLDEGVAFRAAAIIDMNNRFAGRMVDGIPVYGYDQLETALERHDAKCLFLADSDLTEEARNHIKHVCESKKVEVRDYTGFFEFTGETDSLVDVQDKGSDEGVRRSIPFSPPDISEKEIGEVVETLKSGWITTGPRTKLLERRLAAYIETGKTDIDCDTKEALEKYSNRVVCLNSATASEELNLRILGVRKGDEVIVPAYTYTASASAAVHCGATIKFVDIQKDGDSITHMPEMDYNALEAAITEKTKAVIVVDLGGIVADYDRIYEIVNRKRELFTPIVADGTPLGNLSARVQRALGRVAVVADCAHSLGASRVFNGKRKYCGAIADFTSFSFHAVNVVTTKPNLIKRGQGAELRHGCTEMAA